MATRVRFRIERVAASGKRCRICTTSGHHATIPWRGSGFQATLGLRFNDDDLRGVSVPTNGSYVFGGKRYPTVMPYFGIGYGHRPASKGLGFVADLGVAYGIPKCSYTLSPELAAAAGPAKSQILAASGLDSLRQVMSRYRWYPVLQIGISYRF